jgi:hypothetical protein
VIVGQMAGSAVVHLYFRISCLGFGKPGMRPAWERDKMVLTNTGDLE